MAELAYYDGIAEELFGRLNRLRAFTQHAPSVGSNHEEILRETLRETVSPRFQVRTGFSYGGPSHVSHQGDILIVDEMDPSPYLFRQGDLVVVRPRALVSAIEVKTTLTKQRFLQSIMNLASFSEIAKLKNAGRRVGLHLFAFDGPELSDELVANWYAAVDVADEIRNYPSTSLVLRQGMLALMPSREGKEWGSFRMTSPESQFKSRELSVFLATVVKDVEAYAGIRSNPFEHACLDGLSLASGPYRFACGRRFGSEGESQSPSLK